MLSLETLNPPQVQAVTAPDGPILVLAGPGSGKTRVLTYRIAYLIDQRAVDPGEILAVTFTNKAAREMSTRLHTLLQEEGGSVRLSNISLGTFHAQCARLLRVEADQLPFTRDYVIFDDSDQISLIRQILKEMGLDPKQVSPGKVQAIISKAKNELIDVEHFTADDYFNEIAHRVYQRYQSLLLVNNALDFDDLLFFTVRLLEDVPGTLERYRARFRHIHVDEFQDTNTAQYALLRLLAGPAPNIFVVGDPDQSIYRWRGADIRNIQRFQKDYPQNQTILLEQNYRSTQTILDAAMAVIDRNPDRKNMRLFTDRGAGEMIVLHEAYDEADEAAFAVDTIASLTLTDEISPGDVAIMYRTNAQSRPLEEAFLRAGLPYRLVGAQRFYGRREVKDIVAYLRLIQNPADQVSLLRVLNTPPRGIGTKTVETLLAVSDQTSEPPGSILLELARKSEPPYAASFPQRIARSLQAFGESLNSWLEVREQGDLLVVLDRLLSDIDYQSYIDDGTEEGADRWENVLELRSVAEEFREIGLTAFLEQIALVSDQDTLSDSLNAPTLLTMHAAKGLEFPVVIIIGLEEGVIPHQRSFDQAEEMAEERRLFYVGVTRAKDRIVLTRAFRRRLAGFSTISEPSRFLSDLPPSLVEGDHPRSTWDQTTYHRQTTWVGQDAAPVEARFQPGMRVQHPTFGEGIVMESQVDFDDEEVMISFEGGEVRHLMASLANLEILDST